MSRHPGPHPLSGFYVALRSSIQRHYVLLAYTRLVAAALAIKLYECDRGRRPASLSDLVPDYLPSVPMDPMGYGSQEMHYLSPGIKLSYPPDAHVSAEGMSRLPTGAFAALYCMGRDGVDHGGRCYFKPDGTIITAFGPYDPSQDSCDFVFLLDALPSATTEAPAPNGASPSRASFGTTSQPAPSSPSIPTTHAH